jgi:hypothetical protein
MPMMVREPSLATIGMSTREVRKPIPSVCHGCRTLSSVNIPRWPSFVAAAFLLAQMPLAALTDVLTERDITYALTIANGPAAARSLFHAPYIVAIDDPTIEHLEVITEFRRFVLAAEKELETGNWMMGRGGYDSKGRTLKDVLRPVVGQVSLRARLRFHPLNNYSTVPAFDILLGDPTLLAINTIRTPHVSLATGEPGTRDVITGATLEVFYNAPTIGNRALPVRLISEGKELARVSVDFSGVQ